MTKEKALDMLYEGDLYDAFGYVTADGYAALAALDGVVLQERKTGKWEIDELGFPCCSNCRTHYPNMKTLRLYCSHCGAKMEVDE